MNISFLDLSQINAELKDRLRQKFSELLDKGIFSGGKEVEQLESMICSLLHSSHAIPCANGTDALELALRALNIGPGDEVIVPAMTWVSTAEAVVFVGAKPIFWETDGQGLLRSDWEKAVTEKTKCVIPVHLYGKMVNMSALVKKAKAHQLFVIEDAAQSFGAVQEGKAAGTWGDIGCLSFYPTKNLGALGEAGMCLTQDETLAKKIRLLSNHGQPIRDQHELIGRNSRIDSLQAGFLNVLIEEFESGQKIRKVFAKRYVEKLSGVSELVLPEGILEEDHNAHLFVVQTEKRDQLQVFLAKNGIGTAIHYPRIIPDMRPYRADGDFVAARKLANEGLSLPLNPYLKAEEVDWIVDKVEEFFGLMF
ncbi:dTDP-4-amino-4,6-dideoxygalactose transaminase [Algoriphagus faecimaris]|uniref:dTDP-4-amino-4,6-dideoxygalactose transaminase n=1 Tax=Algoriphagus faecimaris TaxID=686796 RepID=A0A1G6RFS5_9BACT|nr:DegT/DnrJ/EryC1/StrS family aminotransferase [Algoriphagus faecimaris]SDD03194.1 dTDP-4-amino-4,6-dideoxygalactose transaminase [Algoriphagus faecimaris]